jgi:hypothetical protein
VQRLAHGIVTLAAVVGLAGAAWGQTPTGGTHTGHTQAAQTGGHTSSIHSMHHLARHRYVRRHGAVHQVAPVQRVGRVNEADGLEAAPVPDENVARPAVDNAVTPGPALAPGELQMHYPPSGEGFLPGSSHTSMDNLNTPKVPGVTLAVPVGSAVAPPAPPP